MSTGLSSLATRPPVHLTPLVGRDREKAEVSRLLRSHRLVSLVGAGGSGKTRLAAAVAADLHDPIEAEAAWIDLAPLSDPTLVAHHAASVLGVREQPGRPVVEQLIDVIGDRPLLLVLDNCEHLVGPCAFLADTLLRACGSSRILATSRQSLGVAGEKAWRVPPLALPAPGESPLAAAGAIQLFVERAQDALPTFTLTDANAEAVARICRRLDGLPLAIELAAARVRLLPPEQLAGRLDNVFDLLTSRSHVSLPRHRTLRALIDWSYDLLAPTERLLFERLSVFSGGFALEAAEEVAEGESFRGPEVLDLLASLVDRSLVTMREWHGEARYSLLETVREYARERHRCEGEGTRPEELHGVGLRHAEHYLRLAEQAASPGQCSAQLQWLARLDLEHDNLRTALAWSVATGRAEIALRLCLALRNFWRIRGHLTEGRRWIEEALRLPGEADALHARVSVWAAVLGRMQGSHGTFGQRLAESEALARRTGDRTALADALTQLGVDLRERHELADARWRLDEAVSLWRELGDTHGLAHALGVRASIALYDGDAPLARRLRMEAVEVSRQAGDREGEARGLVGLGEVERLEGDLDASRTHYGHALPLFESLGDTWHIAVVRHNLGWVAAESGRIEEAYHAFSESITLFALAGNPYGLNLCLIGLARLLHESGDSESAAVALATAAHHAPADVRPAAPADAVSCERTHAAVEATLDPERAARARGRGLGMDRAECIAWAQGKLGAALGPQCHPPAETALLPPGDQARAPVVRGPEPTPDRTATADLGVRALGPLQLFLRELPLEGDAFGSSKPRELLLLLLCHPEGRTRDQVGLAFWPESSAAQVKNSFHVTLHRLRKALGRPEWIVMAGDRYRLDPTLRIDFDAARFETEVHAALHDRDPAHAEARLAAALALYRGEFLEGEVVGDWHLGLRDRLRRVHIDGLLAHARLLMSAERFADAAVALRTLLVRDPMHEEACRHLMLSHARTGERIRALRLYENLSVLLRDELSAAPDEATTALYQRLRRAESV
jgi:predicted ATPase/DNA-binding SARP family transcriptional activator